MSGELEDLRAMADGDAALTRRRVRALRAVVPAVPPAELVADALNDTSWSATSVGEWSE